MASRFKVVATLSDGGSLDITGQLTALSWSDGENELAQKCEFSIWRKGISDESVADKLALCTAVTLYYDDAKIFDGVVWEWSLSGKAETKVAVTCYDKLIYAQNSKDNNYFAKGKKTADIIKAICEKWKIPLEYSWQSYTHDKTVYRGQNISEQIISTLKEAKKKLDKKYVALMVGGKLCVRGYGEKSKAVLTDADITGYSQGLSLSGLVTRVIITGKESSSGKIPIKDTIDGKTEYGILQSIVSSSSSSVKEARTEANELLRESGKPEEDISLQCCRDVPALRRGDRVTVNAGVLAGDYIVLSVSHDAADGGSMDIKLEKAEGAAASGGTGSDGAASGSSHATLRYGSKGSEVKAMQRLLIKKGYALPKYGADGSFGSETLSALKKFQKAGKLSVDGICGAKTWAALEG